MRPVLGTKHTNRPSRNRHVQALLAILVVVTSMSACRGEAESSSAARITRESSTTLVFDPLDTTIEIPGTASSPLHMIRSLPAVDPALRCGDDIGLRYRLRFTEVGGAQEVLLEGAGCLRAHLPGGVGRQTTADLWIEVAKAQGLPAAPRSLTVLPHQ